MKTEGEDYQLYIEDLIGKHVSKFSRTSANFLIVRLCDKFDGLANFIFNFCLQILDFSIYSNLIEYEKGIYIPDAYDLLKDENLFFINILNKFTQESLLDIGIILICSLKNFVIKNKSTSLISKIKFIFDNHIDQLHSVSSELIKFDICLIYDVFINSFMNEEISELSNSDLENITKRLDYLFNSLMNYNINPGIASQAAKAITTIFKEINIDNIDTKYISNIFMQMILHIENFNNILFFDVLIEILENWDIEANLIYAINLSVKRILKEINSPLFYSDDKTSKVIFGKCLNIIKTIIKDNKLYSKNNNISINQNIIYKEETILNINEVENSLEPLFSYLKNPKKITFEDDLLEILKILLINCNSIINYFK